MRFRKVEKLISPFIIIEKTRSGLVSMTIGKEYIKKRIIKMKVFYDSDADLDLIKRKADLHV